MTTPTDQGVALTAWPQVDARGHFVSDYYPREQRAGQARVTARFDDLVVSAVP